MLHLSLSKNLLYFNKSANKDINFKMFFYINLKKQGKGVVVENINVLIVVLFT